MNPLPIDISVLLLLPSKTPRWQALPPDCMSTDLSGFQANIKLPAWLPSNLIDWLNSLLMFCKRYRQYKKTCQTHAAWQSRMQRNGFKPLDSAVAVKGCELTHIIAEEMLSATAQRRELPVASFFTMWHLSNLLKEVYQTKDWKEMTQFSLCVERFVSPSSSWTRSVL